ncbi:MAG TPA: PAS domain S-box protein [Clostridiales bacterium]|nr:PAS domain S-box protein [Clostridiales bacterium]
MKRKIFSSMCIIIIITVLLSSTLISILMYREFYNDVKRDVRHEAEIIATSLNNSDDDDLWLVSKIAGTNRITLILSDGTVFYDDEADESEMDNHLDRPEVNSAIQNRHGEITRFSDTLDEQTFYYAVALDDGTVLRVSNTVKSVFSILANCIPYMIIICVGIFVVAILLASWQTKRIVAPINNLDLDSPMANETYEELSPLIAQITRQNAQISEQMDKFREKQEEFSAITENMKEGLVMINSKSIILFINGSALSLFDVDKEDCINKHIFSMNRSNLFQEWVEKVLRGKSFEEIDIIKGRIYNFMLSPVLVDNSINGAVLLIMDVTEKQAAEKLRREFSANVSHELKTPLTSISGYAEIMKNGLVKQEDVQRFSERIFNEGSRLIILVEDIIKLSRLDESDIEISFENVNLLDLLKDIAERLTPQAEQKDVEISVDGESLTIYGNRQIIDEMIYNLCDNAIKYNRENGQVKLSVFSSEDEIILTVEDTGIGIPEAHRERVFERFYRVDKSHSRETGGTGLGLSIVKHGANYHNVVLKLSSQEHMGTKISLSFPINKK